MALGIAWSKVSLPVITDTRKDDMHVQDSVCCLDLCLAEIQRAKNNLLVAYYIKQPVMMMILHQVQHGRQDNHATNQKASAPESTLR
jgi:hypothetical protein